MANINIRRKSGFILRSGSMRRESLWIDDPTVEASLVGSPTAILLSSLSAAGLALRPFTVVRTRGYIQMRSDQNATRETYGIAMGQCVVSDQAVGIGVTAVPTPVSDKASDLWHVYESLFSTQIGTSATGQSAEIGIGRTYDSKAMRKVQEGEDLITVAENEIAGAIFVHTARILLKLH